MLAKRPFVCWMWVCVLQLEGIMKTQLNNYELSLGLSAHNPLKFKNKKVLCILHWISPLLMLWFCCQKALVYTQQII